MYNKVYTYIVLYMAYIVVFQGVYTHKQAQTTYLFMYLCAHIYIYTCVD